MDKNEQERNEHFKEFARLLFPEVSQLFFTLYARISELRPIEEIDAVELEIKTLIAQRAYDLVYHALYCANINQRWWPGSPEYGNVSGLYHREIREQASDIPD